MLLTALLSCSKPEADLSDYLDFQAPEPGAIINDDSIHYSVEVKTSGQGLLKMSLVNDKGVSIVAPQVVEVNTSATVKGFFLAENLVYDGTASLVALWLREGFQMKKSVSVRLASGSSFSDAFVLLSSHGGNLHLTHLMATGLVRSHVQLNGLAMSGAVWSDKAQTLAITQPDGRTAVAIKPPFTSIDFTIHATTSPHQIAFVAADGNCFLVGETGGNLRAVRATDGGTVLAIPGQPDSLPYAVVNSNQRMAVAFRSGANRHTVRLYYPTSGALHSLWPLPGKVVDFKWQNDVNLMVAVRRPSGIEIYEIDTNQPTIRLIQRMNDSSGDTLFFIPGNAFVVRSGTSLYCRNYQNQLLWHNQWPSGPHVVAVKPSTIWVRMSRNLYEINQSGQIVRQVSMPANNFPGTFYEPVYAPWKE
jgi:hypothetical protein